MKRIYSFILIALLCAGTAIAQDNPTTPAPNDDLVQILTKQIKDLQATLNDKDATIKDKDATIADLNKQLQSLQKQLDKLTKDIDDLKDQNKKLSDQLAQQAADDNVKALKKQIKDLEADTARLAQQLRKDLQDVADKSKSQMDKLEAQHKADQDRITSLQNQLDALQDFQAQYLAQLASSVDTKWLNKTFAEVNLTELEEDYKLYAKFAQSDSQVKAAYNKLTPFVNQCRIYAEAKNAVNSEYDAAVVARVTPLVKGLRDAATNPANKADLTELHSQLNYYKVMVQTFQDLIKSVDQAANGMDNHSQAWPLVNATLKKSQEDIDDIQKIPWLKEQYKQYLDKLQKNCKAPNPVRDLILGLQP